jgi:predicted transcriptional regulator
MIFSGRLLTLTFFACLIPKDLGFISWLEINAVVDVPTPTTRELEILKVLWEQGPCSVRSVHRQLAQHEDLAYNTVQTLMRIMEEKGLVDHQVEGRTFIYTPRFSRDESTARFLDRVFDGAADQLVMSLLRTERIAPQELDRMEEMIAKARRKRG